MAKTKPKTSEPTEVTFKYDLFDLPTAYHKAGLAGLVMLCQSLKETIADKNAVANCTVTATAAEFTFSKSGVQLLLDDLYDARIIEATVKAKRKGVTAKREDFIEEERDGKKVPGDDLVQPVGRFLADKFPSEDKVWLKLWRDMLWSITRSRPATRSPFNDRSERKPCGAAADIWVDLVKASRTRDYNTFHTVDISSALFPAAQAVNAETIPFVGRAEQTFLLHFWTLAVQLFVPNQVAMDGTSEFSGYTIAVPDVTDLIQFVDDYSVLLANLSSAPRGFRPAQAIIDLPAEGALAFMNHLAVIASLKVAKGELRFSVGAVEFQHLVRKGNNVKMMSSGRVSPNPRLLDGYRQIVDPADKSQIIRNPMFRRGLLLALLDDVEWHQPFAKVLETYGHDLFIRRSHVAHDNEERTAPHFSNDAAKRFRLETNHFLETKERTKSMSEIEKPPKSPLAVIINRVVRTYLLGRTESKTSISLSRFDGDDDKTDWTKVPEDFNKAKNKLAESLFLEFRSRKEQAFVDHFAATFFSVTHRFAEADRLELAAALTDLNRLDELKTLTLLSISANS